jgi:non-ribosomal peptide synthetase component F
MPLDPSAPPARIAELLRSARPAALLFDSRHNGPPQDMGAVPGGAHDVRALVAAGGGGGGGSAGRHQQQQQGQMQEGEQQQEREQQQQEQQQEGLPPGGQRVLYVLFTSGSTGEPHGVCGTAAGLLNRVDWMQRARPLAPGRDVVSVSTSPAFVDSVWEVFAPLLAGADAFLPPQGWALQPAAMAEAVARHGVTHMVRLLCFAARAEPRQLAGPRRRAHDGTHWGLRSPFNGWGMVGVSG